MEPNSLLNSFLNSFEVKVETNAFGVAVYVGVCPWCLENKCEFGRNVVYRCSKCNMPVTDFFDISSGKMYIIKP